MKTSIYASELNYGLGLSINVFSRDADGRISAVAEPITMKRIEEESEIPSTPTITISRAEGQRLMDSLWNCGVRPTDGTGSTGQLAAVQAHLKSAEAAAHDAWDAKVKADEIIAEFVRANLPSRP